MNVFADLFSSMGMLALECRQGNEFVPLNALPGWLLKIHPGIDLTCPSLNMGELFPFVENFLVDAEAFWCQPTAARIGSGVWTELDDEGKQHQLEAWALVFQQSKILLLRCS